MVQSIASNWHDLANLFYGILAEMLSLFNVDLSTINIKLGIGQVEFFNLTLDVIMKLIISIVVWYVFIRLIWWIFRSMFNMITGWLK